MPPQVVTRAARRLLLTTLIAAALFILLVTPALAQVTAVNDFYFTPLDTPLNVPAPGVLANDIGGGTITANTSVSNGALVFNADGSFSYTPNAGFTGTDTFTYTLDGTSTATVFINVNLVPTADDDTYTQPANTVVDINEAQGLLNGDVANGAGGLTVVNVSPTTPAGGLLSVNANGSFTYTPLAGFVGTVTFTYQARRGDGVLSNVATVTLTFTTAPTATPPAQIVAQNDAYTTTTNTVFSVAAPGVLANDTSTLPGVLIAQLITPPATGTLIFNGDGSFTYTPFVGFTGVITFTYRAAQGAVLSNIATVTITVNAPFGATPTLPPGVVPTSAAPTALPTFIPLFIPGPTPVPQPVANAGATGELPLSNVQVVVNRDGVNVRLVPAIGAEVIGFVNAGFSAFVRARSGDSQWVKVDFSGEEGWIGLAVLTVLSGDIESLPVEDPRTIPYGGFGSPRAGLTSRTSDVQGILRNSGVRVRSGPSRAYVVLANAPRFTQFSILGRTSNNAWFQVNFNGVLGWVIAREVELQSASFIDLPIDGIVADALPISEDTASNYVGTLRLLLDRLNIAQTSLDIVRQRWTDAALNGRLACGDYPARPTDYALANPLAAAFFDTLVPIVNDFNAAMANVRTPVDLLLQACTQLDGAVGQPQIQIALEAVAAADALFTAVRQRLTQLIPPDREIGPEDCPFTFARQTDILPRLRQGQLAVVEFSARNYVVGFCVDAAAGQQIRVEALAFQGNARPAISVSPFDNPSNFIGVGRATGDNERVTVGPITIDRTGVYLLTVSDFGDGGRGVLDSRIAVLVTDVTGVTAFVAPGLSIDPVTGQLVVNPSPQLNLPTAEPGIFGTPSFFLTPIVIPTF